MPLKVNHRDFKITFGHEKMKTTYLKFVRKIKKLGYKKIMVFKDHMIISVS